MAKTKPLISETYRSMNRALHESPEQYGDRGHMLAASVARLATSCGAKSLLDYGCGKGTLKIAIKELLPGLKVLEYDPAIKGKMVCPNHADLVTCLDVMEHIEPGMLGNVIAHLGQITRKLLFVAIHHRPARKFLADGRNAHLILEPPEWWMEQFNPYFVPIKRSEERVNNGAKLVRSFLVLEPKKA